MSKSFSVVTGGTGYVGLALVKHLVSKGENIRLFLLEDHPCLEGIECEKFIGNICNPEDVDKCLEGAETVYHIAGVVDISGKKEELMWKVNVGGTRNIVESCKRQGVRNLIYVSSIDTYPDKFGTEEKTELSHYSEVGLTSGYAITKAIATQIVLDAKDDLKVCCVQPTGVLGPDDYMGSSLGAMMDLFIKGMFPVSMNFGRYNFVDNRDMAEAMYNAVKMGKSGECYILGGEVITVDELMGYMAESLGRKKPTVKISKGLLKPFVPLISKAMDLAHLPPMLNKFSLSKLEENCNFSNDKAKRELGFKPRPAFETVRDTVLWRQNRLKGTA
ncbi:MAG: NAD-dependent epimerase/dehydratase family protein [Clostridia bacterium]|nr:NAD-dependent epimerase/dehydratase family protein [Clostridia bacterium]MBR3551866.1 NAD-dependent epimerase/dehydratase family protein [Clostridia bacterium]